MRKCLILALDRMAWGRVALGLEIARDVVAAGGEVLFVANEPVAEVIGHSPFRVLPLGDHLGPLAAMCLEEIVVEEEPASVVLCDLHSCSRYFQERLTDPQFLAKLGPPVIAMDIWNCRETPMLMDVSAGPGVPRVPDLAGVAARLVPVPIGRLTAVGGYGALAPMPPLSGRRRHGLREQLGVGPEDRMVMFATAGWQHDLRDADAARLAELLPRLLWTYLCALDRRVHLVHVGPRAFHLDAATDRYHWIGPLAPTAFDELVASADMVLSANVASTSLGRAIAARTPIVVVQNSFGPEAVRERSVSMRTARWLPEPAALFPFRMWPLGYYRFLAPLLEDNAYCSAFSTVEALDEDAFLGACQGLIFDAAVRGQAQDRQAEYESAVRSLPSAIQRIEAVAGA